MASLLSILNKVVSDWKFKESNDLLISENESRKVYVCREAMSMGKIRGILSNVNFNFTMKI